MRFSARGRGRPSAAASAAARSASPATRKPDVRPAAAAFAHFRGGPAREGDGQALRAGDAAIGDEMRDAMDQGAGLARARPGDDQQRTFDHGRRRALIGVEGREDA